MNIIIDVKNVPDYAKNQKGFMVASASDGELWFYGLYDTYEKARDVVRFVTKAVILPTEGEKNER